MSNFNPSEELYIRIIKKYSYRTCSQGSRTIIRYDTFFNGDTLNLPRVMLAKATGLVALSETSTMPFSGPILWRWLLQISPAYVNLPRLRKLAKAVFATDFFSFFSCEFRSSRYRLTTNQRGTLLFQFLARVIWIIIYNEIIKVTERGDVGFSRSRFSCHFKRSCQTISKKLSSKK